MNSPAPRRRPLWMSCFSTADLQGMERHEINSANKQRRLIATSTPRPLEHSSAVSVDGVVARLASPN